MRADYYQLLDVTPEASAKELKAAYYRRALRYHPDRNAGDPAAEERFKLVAEAYRTLGVPERRREYDDWLRLHDRYQAAPELEKMSSAQRVRPFRYSQRQARERQERRYGYEEARRPRRRMGSLIFRSTGKVNIWFFLGFYLLLAFNLLPIFFRHMTREPASARKTAPAEEKTEVSETEARRRVLAMEQELCRRAGAGEADAQYQLGLYLFNKSSRGRGADATPTVLRRAASEGYRREAMHWLGEAARQGHGAAQRLLNRLSSAAQPSL